MVVGFAPAETPEIVVSVVLEGGYSGVSSAQYIAKAVFDAYFNNMLICLAGAYC